MADLERNPKYERVVVARGVEETAAAVQGAVRAAKSWEVDGVVITPACPETGGVTIVQGIKVPTSTPVPEDTNNQP